MSSQSPETINTEPSFIFYIALCRKANPQRNLYLFISKFYMKQLSHFSKLLFSSFEKYIPLYVKRFDISEKIGTSLGHDLQLQH